MTKTVVALFDSFNDAQNVVRDLVNNGFRRDDISMVANDESGRYTNQLGTEPASGAAGGAGIGAVLGGLAGLLIGLGALAIPGIGPVLAAGPLAATLAGAGIGAVTGGLIGALVDAGVPEEEARYYAEGVRRGGTLLTVRTNDEQVDLARQTLDQYHPVDVHQRATQWDETGWSGAPVGDYAATAQPSDFSTHDADFRGNYETAYANMGYSYDQYQPAYKYGYDLASNERYAGLNWEQLEPDVSQDWSQRYPDNNWPDFREAVRYGWERGHTKEDAGRAASGTDTAPNVAPTGTDSFSPPGSADVSERDVDRLGQDQATTFSPTETNDVRSANRFDLPQGPNMDQDMDQSPIPRDNEAGIDRPSEFVRGSGPGAPNAERAGSTYYGPGYSGGERTGSNYVGSDMGQAGATYNSTEDASVNVTGPDWSRVDQPAPGTSYDYDTQYRTHFDAYYAGRGGSYDEYRPAYDYGRDLARERRFHNQDWNDVEPEARRGWEQQHPDTAWDNVKAAVRHAWDQVTGQTEDFR